MPQINELILKNFKKDKYQRYLELLPEIKNKESEKIIKIILTLIASIILGVFAINPTLTTITKLQKQLEDSRIYESKLSEKINNLSTLDQQYQKILPDLPIIYLAIPQKNEIATLTATLLTVANDTSIKLINLQTLKAELSKEAQARKKYSAYEFNIGFQGNYPDLIIKLDKIYNFQRILTNDVISVVKSTSESQALLQMNISGNAFFKP